MKRAAYEIIFEMTNFEMNVEKDNSRNLIQIFEFSRKVSTFEFYFKAVHF